MFFGGLPGGAADTLPIAAAVETAANPLWTRTRPSGRPEGVPYRGSLGETH
jgi:hypothetical protein